MRLSLLIFLACFLKQSIASTYYVSSINGSDKGTNIQAQNINTPWQTLTKVNASTFQPGDSILFKRGEIFPGSLDVNASGSTNDPIVFAAYGTGAKPIITGFTTVPSWTKTRGNICNFYDPSFPSSVNMVVVDGAFQPIGRYPKINDRNGGWLTNQSHTGHESLTSNEIANVPPFVGGQIVMRKYQWLFDVGRITDQTTTTVKLNQCVATGHPSYYYDIMDEHGFFFQNHINTLTEAKEWSYDSAAKKIQMYSPGSSVVEVSKIENLVNLDAKAYISFDNLSFTGANSYAFYIASGSNNISITNCNITYSGINAIHVTLWSTYNITVDGCNISYTNNNAIEAHSTHNWLIQNTIITNTGLVAGMGLTGDGQYNAISYTGDGSIIQYNKIINTGYIGIHFTGNNTTIRNNYIDSFVMIKSDGGGIYTYGETNKSNRIVTGNIIQNGVGRLQGTNEDTTNPYGGQVHGIYMDGGSANVAITNNTVSNCSHSGIWLSSPKGITVTGNTLYNNTVAQLKLEENVDKITTVTIKNNIFFATDTSKLAAAYNLTYSSFPLLLGNIDSNYYERPLFEPENINTQGYPHVPTYYNYPSGGVINCPSYLFKSFDTWKTFSGHDIHSYKSPISITSLTKVKFEFNNTNDLKKVSLDGYYIDSKSKVYKNSVTLDPFSSIVLINIPIPANQTSIWNGSLSSNWLTPDNWDDKNIPGEESVVIIPSSVPNEPVIASGSPTITSITINKGASLSLEKGIALNITGFLINNSTITGAGVITMKGTCNQSISGAGTINNLDINNVAGVNIQPDSKIELTGVLQLTSGLFTTGDGFTLKSTEITSARLAPVKQGNIIGNVTVENYIAARATAGYRLLSPIVTTSGSIKSNWQEGCNNVSTSINLNPAPGCGIHITGSVTGNNGFDATSNGQASLFTFNQINDAVNWSGINNTDVNNLDFKRGYLVYVRGNRSIDINKDSTANSTILRAFGTLALGNVNFSGLGGNGKNSLLTNPYAAPISWTSLYAANGSNFENYYTLWDPAIGSKGGYVTVDATGTSSVKNSKATTEILQGQAFIVRAKPGIQEPTFTVKEDDKLAAAGEEIIMLTGSATPKFYVTLFSKSTTNQRTLHDGVLARFGNNYASSVDGNDAYDFPNFDENISFYRNGKSLSIESRPLITSTDTLYLKIENLIQKVYEWQFDLSDMQLKDGTKAVLADKFTGLETPIAISGSTTISFQVTSDTASSPSDRFSIIFKQLETLPVKMLGVDAFEKLNGINVTWKTTEEVNIDRYEIEKSFDGQNFFNVAQSKAKEQVINNYLWFDNNIKKGYNYYRIKTLTINGQVELSKIVRVLIGSEPTIRIINNPITIGVVNVGLYNLDKGPLEVKLLTMSGQIIYYRSFYNNGGSNTLSLAVNNIPSGIYEIEVRSKNEVYSKQVIRQ